ncbi:MAG: hypothetical protein MUE70_09155, partial [Desulfobacterales bacterium]|nr:hypothetical protein [Desulfobacterales bacterium]
NDLTTDLTCVISMKKMAPIAIIIAFIRKATVSAWSSCSPVSLMVVPSFSGNNFASRSMIISRRDMEEYPY